MKPIEKEILVQLTREQLVELAVQQQKQMQLQDEVMVMQEKRIKYLETEVAYMESMVANQRAVGSHDGAA